VTEVASLARAHGLQSQVSMRALCLLLLLSSCYVSGGRVNPTVTTGVWGGALIVGGAAVAAGSCVPSEDSCEQVESGSSATALTMIAVGAGLLGLAYLLDRSSSHE
jgi:hypothetical protein